MSDFHDLGQRWLGIGPIDVQHTRGLRSKSLGIFPRFYASDSCSSDGLMKAHFDQAGSGRPHGMVIAIALFASHHEFIGKPRTVGESFHATQVGARQDGGRPEQQGSGGAICDASRLGARVHGDFTRRQSLQLVEWHAFLSGGVKCFKHRCGHRSSPQTRHGS